MKHLKYLSAIIVLIMALSLVSCGQAHIHTGKHQNQGSGTGTNGDQTVQPITYVYSITRKVLHLPDCYHIQFMNEDFKSYYNGDIALLFEKGFTICKDCLATKDDTNEDKVIIPDEDEVPAEEATFVVNRSSLTIHMKGCSYIKKMSEKNVKYTSLTMDQLLETEHVPCGHCMHDDYLAYKAAHPEKFEE